MVMLAAAPQPPAFSAHLVPASGVACDPPGGPPRPRCEHLTAVGAVFLAAGWLRALGALVHRSAEEQAGMANDGEEGALAGARAGIGADVRGGPRRGPACALRCEGGVAGCRPPSSGAELVASLSRV